MEMLVIYSVYLRPTLLTHFAESMLLKMGMKCSEVDPIHHKPMQISQMKLFRSRLDDIHILIGYTTMVKGIVNKIIRVI